MISNSSKPPYAKVELDELGIIRLHTDSPNANLAIWDHAFLEAISLSTSNNTVCFLDENIFSKMHMSANEYVAYNIGKRKKIMAVVVPNIWKRLKLSIKNMRSQSSNIKYFANKTQALAWLAKYRQGVLLGSPQLN